MMALKIAAVWTILSIVVGFAVGFLFSLFKEM